VLFLYLDFMQKKRCGWCIGDALYEKYHDQEWGVPIFDDRLLFEFLILETFQAGLSWITVLRKREHFRMSFDAFDYHKVAAYDIKKENELLSNPKIIRNRLKIAAAVHNARAFLSIQKEKGSFSNYIWDFVSGKPLVNHHKKLEEIPVFTPLAEKISNDLKQRGFKFVGPTVIYSHMQATGMVNDHLADCFRHSEVGLER
jgi:DNA-3-methyladenine glycosylase I